MIVNTELEQKGNLFPSKIINYKKDVDTLHFSTKNGVALQVTVVRDSVIRLDIVLPENLKMIFLTGLRYMQAEDIAF